MKVSYLRNFKTSFIENNNFTVDEILNKIKFNENNSLIEFNRLNNTTKDLKSNLPCWTPNAFFNNKRILTNLVELSGFIFLDIDNQEINIDILKQDKYIYSLWNSLSNNGFGLLIKTNNYKKDLFLNYWLSLKEYFKNKYDIKLDENTKDITRCNVISYDSNIYINKNSTIYTHYNENNIINDSENITSENTNNRFLNINSKFDLNTIKDLGVLKKNIDIENFSGSTCIYFKDGIDVRSFFIKDKSIKDGYRNKILYSICITCIYNLNDINFNELFTILNYMNNIKCINPLNINEVKNICNHILNNYKKELISTRKQKFFINQSISLNKKEKLTIIHNKRKEVNLTNILESIDDYLETMNYKLTQKQVAEISGKSLITIKRNWILIKNYIDSKKN